MTEPTLPHNADHGPLVERPRGRNKDADWCGTWFDCQRCGFSRLIRSPELSAELERQRAPLQGALL